jgi:hypothetical protein
VDADGIAALFDPADDVVWDVSHVRIHAEGVERNADFWAPDKISECTEFLAWI